MTPGEYLRRRREAAGVSQAEAASYLPRKVNRFHGISITPRHEKSNIARILAFEHDERFAAGRDLLSLALAFPLDERVYGSLRLGRPIAVCRVCACSDRDACRDPARGNCSWARDDLCSHCVGSEKAVRTAHLGAGA